MFNDKLLLIAELAQSYEGSFEDAAALVDAGADAGADVVKFQVFTADELAVPGYQYYDLYRQLEFSREQWGALFERARRRGLRVAADVFGPGTVSMLRELQVDLFKIHASDTRNRELLVTVARTAPSVLLNCGGSTADEIGQAVAVIRDAGHPALCLLHGFQGSPTEPADTCIGRIAALRSRFGLPVGFADHIGGDHPLALHWPLLAIGAGATVIEKHLTLNRADRKEDYISALNPDEFARMAALLRAAMPAVGGAPFDMPAAECEYREVARKKVLAARPLRAGAVVTDEDVQLKRAPDADALQDLADVVGRTLRVDVAESAALTEARLVPRVQRPRLIATLACRAQSSRLYAKPLHRIGDRSILDYLIARIEGVSRVDGIVLAISEGRDNDVFVEYAERAGLPYVIGDETDVQQRLILAGERGRADLLLRATTESPFLHTDNIESMVDVHLERQSDLTVTEGLPEGTYGEIITLAALKDAHDRGEARHRSELCTLYMFEHPERYRIVRLEAPPAIRRPDIRLTVDYPEDLIVCREIAQALGAKGPCFSVEQIVEFLDARPALKAVSECVLSTEGRIWS